MTPSFEDGEYKIKCEFDECFITLKDVTLFFSKADDYSRERCLKFESQWPIETESADRVQSFTSLSS